MPLLLLLPKVSRKTFLPLDIPQQELLYLTVVLSK
jgi:hypothetical protein